MKSTGIVRRIDDLGRIVIPKEIRRTFNIQEGDPLEIGVNDQEIILRKYVPTDVCKVCGGPYREHIKVSNVEICLSCAKTIATAQFQR